MATHGLPGWEAIPLHLHVTDGGAEYLVDNDDFTKATVLIRLDGDPLLMRWPES